MEETIREQPQLERENIDTCFHNRTDINYWYIMGTIAIIVFGIICAFNLPINLFKFHMLIHLIGFAVVQVSGWLTGQFKKDIANGFFKSIKAYDIYAHIYGGFVLYLFFLTIFHDINSFTLFSFEINQQFMPFFTFYIIPVFGFIYEFIELMLEYVFSYFENKKQNPGTYYTFISEPLGNVFQDVIADLIGSFIGLLYACGLYAFI